MENKSDTSFLNNEINIALLLKNGFEECVLLNRVTFIFLVVVVVVVV